MVTFASIKWFGKGMHFQKNPLHLLYIYFLLSQTSIRAHIMDSSSVKLNPNTCSKNFVKAGNHDEKIVSTFAFPT